MAKQSAFSATSLYKTPMVDKSGMCGWVWAQQFQQASAQLISPVPSTPPASSTASGISGQIATDGDYLYVCVGANQWKRTPLTSF